MRYELTEEGERYLKEGLPERRLVEALKKAEDTSVSFLKNKIKDFAIALSWCKKNGWVEIRNGKIHLIKEPERYEIEDALRKVHNKESPDERLLAVLLKRNLVREVGEDVRKKALEQLEKGVKHLTPELIKSGLWRRVKFPEYNIKIIGKRVYPGKRHVISLFIEKIRKIFFDMGFREVEGPLVESSFWNFDTLYQPQDHPARDLADTFYMKRPESTSLPERELVERVKKTHENGWETGSTGWGYEWDANIAKSAVMRTHTTAVSARMLGKIKPPAKLFCVGRVFRNETIDYKHLPEFTQIEGIVADERANFRHLLGYLREFYRRLGFEKIRFRPAYFPYTEMSVEPEVYFEERDEWLELGGAGIFRPEVTIPLGIRCPVLAWGLGLERPIMLKLGLNDIRNFYYRNDLEFLRGVKIWL